MGQSCWITFVIITVLCHNVYGQDGKDSTPPIQQQQQHQPLTAPQNQAQMETKQPSDQKQQQTSKDNLEKVLKHITARVNLRKHLFVSH